MMQRRASMDRITQLKVSAPNIALQDNPFENPATWTPYEVFKLILLFPLALIRVILASILLVVAVLLVRLMILGLPAISDDQGCLYHTEPLPAWRRSIGKTFVYIARLITVCFGFLCVNVVDSRADPSKTANIIVGAPHLTDFDMFFIFWAFGEILPAVADMQIYHAPLVSSLGIANQSIFVDVYSKESKAACKRGIAKRASKEWTGAPLLIFPEGRITNGSVLIQFKSGAFNPGEPVQPVLMRYPYTHYNPVGQSGANNGIICGVIRLLTQFYNSVEVELLDVYEPSAEEREDPILFARNVREVMARNLDVPVTEHSYEDAALYKAAISAGVAPGFVVHDVEEAYSVDQKQLRHLLAEFQRYDTDHNGWISRDEFEKVLQETIYGDDEPPQAAAQIFDFFDADGDGCIQYLEFVQAMTLLNRNASGTGGCSQSGDGVTLAFLIYAQGEQRTQGLPATVPVSKIKGLPPNSGYYQSQAITISEFREMARKHPEVVE
eukprot:CAMPEP_0178374632 /NCGR_PEP_ID=MMETSP0689_2-20121128/2476_1 /TAXON_ID=160604 /ORGANISM="Amphidinium massartii, Strain CS-259" /LENGTH=495 /DNA_ID=CAMNT_0019994607 /DNA_START=83 /DNA_END=1567 /DNA_ORIENTATION=+